MNRARQVIEARPVERPRPLGTITASARRITTAELRARQGKGRPLVTRHAWQEEAWDMYDLVGEQRFLSATLAGRMSKARLYVGKVEDRDSLEDPEPVEDVDLINVLRALGKSASGRSQLIERLAVNLFVAGEGWLVGIPEELLVPEESPGPGRPVSSEGIDLDSVDLTSLEWQMLSTSEVTSHGTQELELDLGDRKLTVSPDSVYLIRVWRPHPRKKNEADSPTRASLPILKELVGLTMHISAQVDSRLAGAGLLIVPEGAQAALARAAQIEVPVDGTTLAPDVFTESLIEAMLTPIQDRGSASAVVPLVVTVPDELVDKFNYMTFSKPLDSEARNLRDEAIRRLALGQDAPPEVLLGTAGMNHWGGWLVQEDTVATHLEPPLALICDALTTQYLWPVLESMGTKDFEQYVIWYDVGHLVVNPNRQSDASSLYDKGVISDETLRREHGFDETDAPASDDPVKAMILELIRGNPGMLRSTALEDMIDKLKAIMEDRPLPGAATDVPAEQALPQEGTGNPAVPSGGPETAPPSPPLPTGPTTTGPPSPGA